jgi:hypothetical protein
MRAQAMKGERKGAHRHEVRAATIAAALQRYQPIWRQRWVADNLGRIDRIPEGATMSRYAAQLLIVGCLLKAMACELWPGQSKERQRFVQLLVEYAPATLGVKTISVPLLKAYLSRQGWTTEACVVAHGCHPALHRGNRVLGIDTDMTEGELMSLCPNIPREILRKFSYANVLFDELHRYTSLRYDEEVRNVDVPSSEIGYLKMPEHKTWMIHFGIDWLRGLVISTEELSRSIPPNKTFDQWWLS